MTHTIINYHHTNNNNNHTSFQNLSGIFRENLKRCFNVKLNSSELGYCVAAYGDKKSSLIASPAFLTNFLRVGKAAR